MSVSDGAIPSFSSGVLEYQKEQQQQQQPSQRQILAGGKDAAGKSTTSQSLAARPEDLSVTPWYLEDYPTTDTSPGPMGDRSSYPSYLYADERDGRSDLNSTRNSSIESEFPKSAPTSRKACMDLKTAMALLDETCPNQVEPSPSLTPRTPRTPLTPYLSRNKRARSKSSDNSSYSNDRLSDHSFETQIKDKDKKRPFLRKIGISKTEDGRPFLAKLTPRIIGKPYLEKIGPSKAVERPFLDKIGSSKTLDKFIFDTSHSERKSQAKIETKTNDAVRNYVGVQQNNVIHETDRVSGKEKRVENAIQRPTSITSRSSEQARRSSRLSQATASATFERRRSGKEFLLKMYSFETEDLESPVPLKSHRDPWRGSSLDDVLDSGLCSLPLTENSEEQTASKPELLKCRVTTSEKIVSSSTTCLHSSRQVNNWSNSSPSVRGAQRVNKESITPISRRVLRDSREILRSGGSTPNSPTKRPISSVSPDRDLECECKTPERGTFSPTKTRKSTCEDIEKAENTHRSIKYNQFERRGISSDNLLAKDAFSFSAVSRTITDDSGRMREISSEDSLATRRGVQEYTKETFKQLQDKFELQEILSTESYAAFKRRTRAAHGAISRQERLNLLPATTWTNVARAENVATIDATRSIAIETATEDKREQSRESATRSVLRKQEGIDHPSDQESDTTNASVRRPKRRIFHEPSQETMDLLTELRKIKSLLKTPSWEKDLDLDQKPMRMPKRILLTDKEFCLSVERENSVRRPSRMINSFETADASKVASNREQEANESRQQLTANSETKVEQHKSAVGPALFEKKCLSLDYVDEEKPQKPEARAISLASTPRDLPFETEEIDHCPILTSLSTCKNYSADVFDSPFEEMSKTDQIDKPMEEKQPKKPSQNNHCAEVDIAIPIDQRIDQGDVQGGRTSDLYEIISPRSATPFRVKKRLGKISVEETVKPENFTLGSKIDCRSVVVAQKRTKCFPL